MKSMPSNSRVYPLLYSEQRNVKKHNWEIRFMKKIGGAFPR